MSSLPAHEFILKIASRCNLNCDYCYEYNLGDSSWRLQPVSMSTRVAQQAATRIAEHVVEHRMPTVCISLHGGEPLAVGPARLDEIATILRDTITPHARLELGVQTNATLVTPEIIDVLQRHSIAVGVSIDGPERVNDLHRVTHNGRSSFTETMQGIRDLEKAGRLTGLLSVIDVSSDPLEVFDFVASLKVDHVDFLLPHHNWTRLPPRPRNDPTEYGQWYGKIWSEWVSGRHSWMRIRYFEQIVRTLVGATGIFEGLGIEPVQLLIIAPDGSLEAVDTLKSCGDDQHLLKLNIFDSPIHAVAAHAAYLTRQAGLDQLCSTCSQCRLNTVCGGGYFPHRYQGNGSFSAPSVYCADLMYLIDIITSDIRTRSQRSHDSHTSRDHGKHS